MNFFRCTEQCPLGRYGEECERECSCMNGGTCDPITGVCVCLAGWRGALCEEGISQCFMVVSLIQPGNHQVSVSFD